jgi:hypothetical protein
MKNLFIINEEEKNRILEMYSGKKNVIRESDDESGYENLENKKPVFEKLIDAEITNNDSEDFGDEFEYADNIISWVVDAFISLPGNDGYFDKYDDIHDYLKDNYGEIIISQYERDYEN